MEQSNNSNGGQGNGQNNNSGNPNNNQRGPGQGQGQGQGQGGGNRRHHHNRRPNRGFNRGPNPNQQGQGGQQAQGGNQPSQGQSEGPRDGQRDGQRPNQRHHNQNHQNRRPHPNNQGQPGEQRQGQGGGGPRHPHQGQGPRHHNNNHRRPQHGHHQQQAPNRPKNGVDAIFDRYENLMQEHVNARRKYYDLYYTADDNQIRKLEDNFYRTLEAVRRWEDNLEPWKKEFLLKKIEMYGFDTTYSQNRELIKPDAPKPSYGLYSGLSDTPPEAPFEDPHYLQTQKQSFQEDTEESVGSIEDYKRLKGL